MTWSKHWQASNGITNGYPRITFTGLHASTPTPTRRGIATRRSGRFATTSRISYDAKGRHDLRAGAEFVDHYEDSLNCNQCGGTIDARGTSNGAAIPTPAQMQAWFPDPFNADTWNFAALSPWVRTYTIGIGEFPNQYQPAEVRAPGRRTTGASPNKLTLNLGLRYDLSINSWANDLGLEYRAGQPPFYAPGRPNDTNNMQPRLGFAYQLNDRTVIRGGSGIYFSDALTVDAFWPKYNTQLAAAAVHEPTRDGRATSRADPLNGATAADLRAGADAPLQLARRKRRTSRRGGRATSPAPHRASSTRSRRCRRRTSTCRWAQSWNSSIGFQRQFGTAMSVEVGLHPHQGHPREGHASTT